MLHWLGITKIHNFISMSDMKSRPASDRYNAIVDRLRPCRYNAIVESGIKIVNRVEIPPEMVPKDAQVEIAAKVFHGYHAGAGYAGMDEAPRWGRRPKSRRTRRRSASPEATSGRPAHKARLVCL